jgi:sugar phosphate isomerase/epimerase
VYVAISTRCFSDLSFPQACAQVLDLEFDKLEIWLDDAGHLSATEASVDPERFVESYRDTTRVVPVAINIGHPVSSTVFRGLSKVAKFLRITQITLPAAPLGTPFNSEIERLREHLRVGSQDGVRVSIRTQAGALTEDPHTAVELCQSVPGLGLTLDPSHYLRAASPERALDLAYPHTFHLHLRDSTREQVQVPVGLGEVDYSRMVAQLRRVDYARALSIDMDPALMEPEQRPIELRKMRMLLETLL